jgi:uncharacterized protein (DUF2147 family)
LFILAHRCEIELFISKTTYALEKSSRSEFLAAYLFRHPRISNLEAMKSNTMLKIGKLSALLMILFMASAFVPAEMMKGKVEASDIVGLWMPSEGTAYVKIFKEKGKEKYHGRIVWLKEPNDENGNPKTDPEGKAILNMLNLRDFVFDEDEWVDGTIYDPKSGNTYYCTIEMINKNKLEVRGSLDPFGLVGRTDTWVRMKNN